MRKREVVAGWMSELGSRGVSLIGVWVWIIIAWVVGYFIFSQYIRASQADISYSTFKSQVAEGAVATVSIEGQQITGTFEDEFTRISPEGDTAEYEHFITVNPGYENEELMAMLDEHDVSVRARRTDTNSWLWWVAILILPWIFLFGYGLYLRNQISKSAKGGDGGMFGGSTGIFGVGKSKAKRYDIKKSVPTRFDDVAGQESSKRDLQETVEYLKNPGKFTALGAEIPRGLLLMGPPGTGKTLLARAAAGEAGVPFYSISGSEFIEMFVGVGASRVRDMFASAKREAPAIIFVDELDSIGRTRGTGVGGGHDEREQTLNQILSEMDGFEPHESVIVIAATNRPDVLDPALTRPGRFDRRVILDLPHRDVRTQILKIHTRKVPLGGDTDLEEIARRTAGFSGADLKNLVNEAALLAGRRGKQVVERAEFNDAADRVILGTERDRPLKEEDKRIIAYHEAGHALVAKSIPGADPVQKVTILPHGQTLGATEQIPDVDRYNLSREYLLGRLAISLGGRVAEKLVFNEMTNGGASDLKTVTRLARTMVCQWGMSDRLGAVTFNQGEDHVFLGRELTQPKDFSERTAAMIDEEVLGLINVSEKKAHDILADKKSKLDRVVEVLMERETIYGKELEEILQSD